MISTSGRYAVASLTGRFLSAAPASLQPRRKASASIADLRPNPTSTTRGALMPGTPCSTNVAPGLPLKSPAALSRVNTPSPAASTADAAGDFASSNTPTTTHALSTASAAVELWLNSSIAIHSWKTGQTGACHYTAKPVCKRPILADATSLHPRPLHPARIPVRCAGGRGGIAGDLHGQHLRGHRQQGRDRSPAGRHNVHGAGAEPGQHAAGAAADGHVPGRTAGPGADVSRQRDARAVGIRIWTEGPAETHCDVCRWGRDHRRAGGAVAGADGGTRIECRGGTGQPLGNRGGAGSRAFHQPYGARRHPVLEHRQPGRHQTGQAVRRK